MYNQSKNVVQKNIFYKALPIKKPSHLWEKHLIKSSLPLSERRKIKNEAENFIILFAL